MPSWTVSWRTGRWPGTVTGCGTRHAPRASRRRRWPRWTGWSWRCQWPLPRRWPRLRARPAARPTAFARSRPSGVSSAVEDDLAWAAGRYRDLVRQALAMAAVAPLSPAAYRDATGTSRRYVLAILEDLDRRELLRRTDAGHVLGPRTIARLQARAAATGEAVTGAAAAAGAAPGGEADA